MAARWARASGPEAREVSALSSRSAAKAAAPAKKPAAAEREQVRTAGGRVATILEKQ